MSSSGPKSPIPNLTPLKRSADELSYAIVPYTGNTNCSVDSNVGEEEVVVAAQPIGPGIPLPSETPTDPKVTAAAGEGDKPTEKECLAAQPIGPGIPHTSLIPTVSARRRKKYASLTPSKRSADELSYAIVPYTGDTNCSVDNNVGEEEVVAAQPIGPGISLPSETATDPKVTVAAAAGEGDKSTEKECLVARPIGPGIPHPSLIPTVSARRRKKYAKEIHRRPAWLPVGWTTWRIIRTAGSSHGHVDSYFYPPMGRDRVRSAKAVFYHLKTPTTKLPPTAEVPENVEEEFEYVVPKEMVTWYGPEAGVTVEFVNGIRLLPGEVYCIDPAPISEIPPISVKTVKLPVGLRYRRIGNYFKKVVDVKAKAVEVKKNVVKVEPSEEA